MMKNRITDYLVIGSGIAGLTYAIKMAKKYPESDILIISKTGESNTRFAQGGIAVVTDKKLDSLDNHVEDTLRAGDYENDREVVEIVVNEAPDRLNDLISWGAEFDHSDSGILDLGREGGHGVNRIVHYKDITGYYVEQVLIRQLELLSNIEIIKDHFVKDLIIHQGECRGAEAVNIKEGLVYNISASTTILATGGSGQMYLHTTNPVSATGDGVAMAYLAGAEMKDMEYIQFHPTSLYQPGISPAFLISEAVRGFGAELCTPDGKRFMYKYDERGSLASRDIVSRAIEEEKKAHNLDFVCLDCRDADHEAFLKHFPNIYEKCISIGIDPFKDFIPVTPAAHYGCGGIKTDHFGRTNINSLYAIGECSGTGLHGANRLASNSLLEGLVFAHRAFLDSSKKDISAADFPAPADIHYQLSQKYDKELAEMRVQLQHLMDKKAGIVKYTEDLAEAKVDINSLKKKVFDILALDKISIPLLELRNLIINAELVVEQSLKRSENKGAFFNKDLAKAEVLK